MRNFMASSSALFKKVGDVFANQARRPSIIAAGKIDPYVDNAHARSAHNLAQSVAGRGDKNPQQQNISAHVAAQAAASTPSPR